MGEKRQNPRRRPVSQYVVINRATDEIVGTLEDLSQGGLKLTSKEAVEVGVEQPLRISLTPDVHERKMVRFDARCMWRKPMEQSGLFLSGYEITHIREADKPVFAALLQHLLVEQGTLADRTIVLTKESNPQK